MVLEERDPSRSEDSFCITSGLNTSQPARHAVPCLGKLLTRTSALAQGVGIQTELQPTGYSMR